MLEPERLLAIFNIIVADLLLSGDNAVVIGMAARSLSPENRRRAVIFGGVGAIGLRIVFTAMAALLLDIPYLQAVGGLLLVWIAYRLLRPNEHAAAVGEAGSLGQAIRTIVLADVVMSLDNILAVAASAHGDVGLLLFGLALSIPIILFGSNVVARLLGRYPILVYLGAVVLLYAALRMILEDRFVHDLYAAPWTVVVGATVVVSAAIILLARWLEGRTEAGAPEQPPAAEEHRDEELRGGVARETQGMNPNPGGLRKLG